MKKSIVFFSIDRLGDYLIRSNLIYQISKKYDKKEIICSNLNFKLISNQKFLNKITIFDLKKKNFNKLNFIKRYFFKKYDTVIVFDGKTISYLLMFIINAKNKYAFIYKKNGFINIFLFNLFKFILNILKIKFETLNSRELIEKGYFDNYPKKYNFLKQFYNYNNNNIYYLNKSKLNFFSKFKDNYILIHLDEKFNDIEDIKTSFEKSLIAFKKKIKKKIILTSHNNKFDYYKKLNLNKVNFKKINYNMLKKSNILIIENVPIKDFQNLIENSYYNISCHSGYFVHTSLALNKKTIDIINKNDEKWLSSWVFKSNNYKLIYKSNVRNSKKINIILNNIQNEINES